MDGIKIALPVSHWQGRRYRRFELVFPVRIKIQSGPMGREIEAVSKNVSLGGLLVRSVVPIPPHTPVTFILSVHGEESVRPVHLIGKGEVVRLESGEPEASFALALKCTSPVTQLEEFLP